MGYSELVPGQPLGCISAPGCRLPSPSVAARMLPPILCTQCGSRDRLQGHFTRTERLAENARHRLWKQCQQRTARWTS